MRDIAVVVDGRKPARNVDSDTLARTITGRIENWSELGRTDITVEAFVVGTGSSTRGVFRKRVLAGRTYAAAVRRFIDRDVGPVGQAVLRGRFVGAN